MSPNSDHLYELLPAIFRLRDGEQGDILRALLATISKEFDQVEADIANLYENWFIETSNEWVVPYIGDMLGVRGLNTLETDAFSQRAYVANTISYRRRKGTAHVLKGLATDVTGWPAQAVEFFMLLQTTQYLNHLRLFNTRPDLRDINRLDLLDSPFDSLPHTVDVRHISKRRGKFNIPNIGLFLWRLQNYPLTEVVARKAEGPNSNGFLFSPIGHPQPLFNAPTELGASEQAVPAPIRPIDFSADLRNYGEIIATQPSPPKKSRYYGPDRSLNIIKDGEPILPEQIMCKDLSAWASPPSGKVAVDVALGRIAFAPNEAPTKKDLIVSFNYGFSADIGGGPYDRRERLVEISTTVTEFQVGRGKTYSKISTALTAWASANKPSAVIRIYDSATYEEKNLAIELPKNGLLTFDCENGERPTLICTDPIEITSNAADIKEKAAITISGLLLQGSVNLMGKIAITFTDCTLVPGIGVNEDGSPTQAEKASLRVDPAEAIETTISIERSIVGALEIPQNCERLAICDSIVAAPLARGKSVPTRPAICSGIDADGVIHKGPQTRLERVTVFGEVHVQEISLASEVIFIHRVYVEHRQTGCIRFSYVPEDSRTPKRYSCQPDLALARRKKELDPERWTGDEEERIAARVRPQFTSLQYGQPAYAQLAAACAEEIKTGAEDGSEMGAFCMLQQPQREANLRIALDEYLRFGLEAGIFFVT